MQFFLIVLLQVFLIILPGNSIAEEGLSNPEDAEQVLDALSRLEVPRQLINIGRWDEGSFALLAEKQSQKLYLFDSSYNLIKIYQITTGQNHGSKERPGDRKTPEGVYFFTGIKEDKELLQKYGLLAFPINYPNFFDRLGGKDGNGIWLHATDQPTRPIKAFDTKGCIVMVNEDILELARHIKLQTTPLIIVNKIEFVSVEIVKEEDQRIRKFLKKWRENWEGKNLNEYMNSYSEKFKSRGMDWNAWKRYKASLNQINSERMVSIREVKILRQSDEYIVASFLQRYAGEGANDTGIKRLYLEEDEEGLKIIGEEWNAIPKNDMVKVAEKLSEKLGIKVAKNAAEKSDKIKIETKGDAAEIIQDTNDKKAKVSPKEDKGIAIENFQIDTQNGFKVRFHLVNKKGERHKLQGRLVIIGIGANKKTASYPAMKLSNGIPRDFRKGEWYSIKRFKIVKGELGKDVGFKGIKVIVYSNSGKVIVEKEFPAV